MARNTFVLPFAPVLLAMVATPLAAGKVVRRSMVEAVTSLNTEKKPSVADWQNRELASKIAASNLSSWKFYHVGKTGGGTVNTRAHWLLLDLKQCHPQPCELDLKLATQVLPSDNVNA